MSRITAAAIGRAASILVLLAVASPPAARAAECNAFISIDYVSGPQPAVPGDTERVRLTLFTGSITGGVLNQLTTSKLRFALDCDVDFALGLPCTDDGSVAKYQRNITSTGCLDAFANPVSFADNSAPGNLTPNEVVFTPSAPVVLDANTDEAGGCQIEFDVQINSYSNDSSPNDVEQVAGFRIVSGTPDASCDNALPSTASQSASIPLAIPTATATATATPTTTPTATPTLTDTPTATGTVTETTTPSGTPTATQSPTPTTCLSDPSKLIPGYCNTEVNDCLQEFCTDAPVGTFVSNGMPKNVVECKNNDPACDHSPGDDVCVFQLSLCFNIADTRFPCVAADNVGSAKVRRPGSGSRHLVDKQNRDALVSALLGLGATAPGTCGGTGPLKGQPCSLMSDCDSTPGSGDGACKLRLLPFAPPLTATTCTAPASIRVPLRLVRSQLRKATKVIRLRFFPTAAKADGDVIILKCLP